MLLFPSPVLHLQVGRISAHVPLSFSSSSPSGRLILSDLPQTSTKGLIIKDPSSRRSCLCGLFSAVVLLSTVLFLGTTFFDTDYKQSEFDLSGSDEVYRHINILLNKRWRNAHNLLMAEYDNHELSDDEVMKTLLEHLLIIKDQFRNKLIMRRSEKGKAISEANKKNRAKQINHCLGGKSLLRRNYEAAKGLSYDEALIRNLKTGYPKHDKVMKALDWIDTEEAMEMAKTEMMSKEALIRHAIYENVGKSTKTTRFLGLGSSLSSNTSH